MSLHVNNVLFELLAGHKRDFSVLFLKFQPNPELYNNMDKIFKRLFPYVPKNVKKNIFLKTTGGFKVDTIPPTSRKTKTKCEMSL
jgi:hypothetical protein